MQIGRLAVKVRRTEERPSYYRYFSKRRIDGRTVEMEAAPFDGRKFLHRRWASQDDELWCSNTDNGLVSTATLARTSYSGDWNIVEEQTREHDLSLVSFRTLCNEAHLHISASYSYKAEGKLIAKQRDWHGNMSVTVLETTKINVQFRSEKHQLLLLPGTTAVISFISLIRELRGNTRATAFGYHSAEIEYIRSLYSSAKTPLELARKLKIKPIRLENKLVQAENKR